MPRLSYWEKTSFFEAIDFAIIGSGIVGINAALRIKSLQPNSKVIILESGMIPTGASTRNAGFACFGSISELMDDLEHMSEPEVLDLVEMRWEGLRQLREIVGTDLGYEDCGGYELFRNHDDSHQLCHDKMDYWNDRIKRITGIDTPYVNADKQISDFGFKGIQHLILNKGEGAIHTGNMMKALLKRAQEKNITIYNGAHVRAWESKGNGVEISTEDGRRFMTQKMLIATNGFAPQLLDGLDIQPARNQVCITQPIPDLKVRGTFHYDKGYYYFRNVGDRILFGGGRNLNPHGETTDRFGFSTEIKEQLKRMLKEIILPETAFEIEHWWSGILGVGQVKQPIIRKIDERVAISVRMGGMGIAIGSLVGQRGADVLLS